MRIQGFGREPDGKRPLGRQWRRWENNSQTNIHEIRCGGMEWTDVAQDSDKWWTLVDAVMNLRVP